VVELTKFSNGILSRETAVDPDPAANAIKSAIKKAEPEIYNLLMSLRNAHQAVKAVAAALGPEEWGAFTKAAPEIGNVERDLVALDPWTAPLRPTKGGSPPARWHGDVVGILALLIMASLRKADLGSKASLCSDDGPVAKVASKALARMMNCNVAPATIASHMKENPYRKLGGTGN
jgi:hypothetical protein